MTTAADALSVPAQAPASDAPALVAPPVAEYAAAVTTALIAGWRAIRARHPDVPEAVISMATGGRESHAKLAHFAAHRWRGRNGGTAHHEVFVTAESLEDGAEEVFESLVHEAAHGLNETRSVNDCSASQYHNKHFKAAAAELGLAQKADVSAFFKKRYGFAGTRMTDETKAAYAEQIAALDAAIHATRVRPLALLRAGGGSRSSADDTGIDSETDDEDHQDGPAVVEKEDRNYAKAVCNCEPPTVIRVSPRTLSRRSILCGDCESTFAPVQRD
ncbi:hypothetical protein [Wenjunlia tyrosinilytica]|uniref:SprT-like family protein n=1 Tax=Wenjunlia tyrosinilytica TaxID=1544741 RepID=A0A917ZY86_9ACTN|nr:hypothetical protein [Wenjunlia tyrosinilytica]GGO98276.1 hypothetical protein GCM10012280_62020 [Wenjunlia tyrosinilytica]